MRQQHNCNIRYIYKQSRMAKACLFVTHTLMVSYGAFLMQPCHLIEDVNPYKSEIELNFI